MQRTDIMAAIFMERYRQNILHPWSKHTPRLAVIVEEIGEVGTALQHNDIDNLKEELTQLAALCVRWLEEL
jgi:NTP pyrophosphatase (non-canonical NTP hydrolase)